MTNDIPLPIEHGEERTSTLSLASIDPVLKNIIFHVTEEPFLPKLLVCFEHTIFYLFVFREAINMNFLCFFYLRATVVKFYVFIEEDGFFKETYGIISTFFFIFLVSLVFRTNFIVFDLDLFFR